MTGELDLDRMLADLEPSLHSGEFVFCSLPGADYGDYADLSPLASVLEPEGLSLVLPRAAADRAGLGYDAAAQERLKPSDLREWFNTMNTLSENVESRIMKLLLSLTKLEKDNNSKLKKDSPHSEKYKGMYREFLTHKMKSKTSDSTKLEEQSETPSSFAIHELLQKLSELLKS